MVDSTDSTDSTDSRVAECAECGRTSPLTSHGDGTPKGWAYIADAQITLCPLHKQQRPKGWQDIMQTYSRAELTAQAGGSTNHLRQRERSTTSSRRGPVPSQARPLHRTIDIRRKISMGILTFAPLAILVAAGLLYASHRKRSEGESARRTIMVVAAALISFVVLGFQISWFATSSVGQEFSSSVGSGVVDSVMAFRSSAPVLFDVMMFSLFLALIVSSLKAVVGRRGY